MMAFGSYFIEVCLPLRGLMSSPQAFSVSVSLAAEESEPCSRVWIASVQ
jgi:hypothetical protein